MRNLFIVAAIVAASAVCTEFILNEDSAYADNSGQCGDELFWEYTENDRTLTISGSGAMNDFSDREAPWYGFHDAVRYVILPERLTHIGNYAFSEFFSLDHIEIPGNVRSIGEGAFDTCRISTFVSIPESVKSIGYDAFRDCLVKTVYNFSGLDIQPLDYMLPSDAVIVSDRCGEHLLWEYAESSRTLIFFGSGDMNDYTDAGTPWYSVRKEAEHVVFPAGLTHIGGYALRGFGSLVSVTIPENVASIGEGAFYGCCMIPSVTVPSSVETIGDEAFCGCAGLTSAVLSGSLKTIGDGAFYACTRLTEMNIPDGVTSVGGQAFCGCIGLTSVTVPRSVEAIGDEAFLFCPVATLYNYSSLEIGKGAFGLPDTAEIFSDMCGDDLFWKYDEDSGTLVLVGKGAMYDYPDESEVPWYGFSEDAAAVELPAGLTHIGNHAFSGFASLTSVAVPGSVVSVGDWAFSGCSGLTEVSVSSGSAMASIGDGAFSYCRSLSSPVLPASLVFIGDWAFSGCSGLTEAVIPDLVGTVGERAFSQCSALSSVTIPGSVERLGEGLFEDCCSLAELFNLSGFEIGHGQYGLSDKVIISSRCGDNLAWAYNESSRTLTFGGSGAMEDYGKNSAPWKEYRDAISRIVLPDGLTRIGSYAFSHFDQLVSADLPDSVVTIGNRAFGDCQNLTAVDLPDSLETIERYAFAWCCSLRSVDLPDSLKTIGYSAFIGCEELVCVDMSDSLETIAGYAFRICTKLTSVEIPRSVTEIGKYAFGGWGLEEAGNVRCFFCYSDLDFKPKEIGLPADAVIFTETCGDHVMWRYSETDRTLTVGGSGAMEDYTSADKTPWYPYHDSISHVVLLDGLTRIGSYAFCGCTGLTALDIPDSVTTIGIRAFGECRSLASVSVLGSAETIGDYAFCGCSSLTYIIIPETVKEIGKDAFKGCPIGTVYNNSDLDIVPDDVGLSPDASVRNECPSVIEVSFFNGTGNLGIYEEAVGRHYVFPEDPRPRDGYRFVGWFNSEGTEITSDTIVVPDDDTVLYAQWEEVPA